jgi:hypothetical protein
MTQGEEDFLSLRGGRRGGSGEEVGRKAGRKRGGSGEEAGRKAGTMNREQKKEHITYKTTFSQICWKIFS